jgi:hypothetical protein
MYYVVWYIGTAWIGTSQMTRAKNLVLEECRTVICSATIFNGNHAMCHDRCHDCSTSRSRTGVVCACKGMQFSHLFLLALQDW